MNLSEERKKRAQFLNQRVLELYSMGKKPVEIAKKLGISEERVQYYIHK